MTTLVPNAYLFKFEIPVRRCLDRAPWEPNADSWDGKYRLPPLHQLEGLPGFGEVYFAWNEHGLFLGAQVTRKRRAPDCHPARFRQSDVLRVMTDMRDTRSIRRATRFCQQFYFLPTGGGKTGKEPVAGSAPIPRAQADAPAAKPDQIPIRSRLFKGGYSLSACIPAESLAGFDPAESPRIGLFAILEDTELGHQSLTIDDDLNWWCDPSTWPTAVLTA